MRRYLRDPTFSRFDTIPECDGHTHTHTHTHTQTDRHTTTAYTALSKASRGKNVTESLCFFIFVIHVKSKLNSTVLTCDTVCNK